jgi:hypothetical protein
MAGSSEDIRSMRDYEQLLRFTIPKEETDKANISINSQIKKINQRITNILI